MTPHQIQKLVDQEITSFEFVEPAPDSTIGEPWPESKVRSYIDNLKGDLVTPYKRRFVLRDTAAQMSECPPDEADYWAVAEAESYLEFYDPCAKEFGLATPGTGDSLPETVGVRGDLISTYCAM